MRDGQDRLLGLWRAAATSGALVAAVAMFGASWKWS
jgi:hypothetical protein